MVLCRILAAVLVLANGSSAFSFSNSRHRNNHLRSTRTVTIYPSKDVFFYHGQRRRRLATNLNVYNDKEEKEKIEGARLGAWKSRRVEIRSMLKSAENVRNFRIQNGYVPELDEEGNPAKDGGKTAISLTAFAVTAGAIILRVGGRAALVSAVGLDFANDNPELQNQIDQVLGYSDTMDPIFKSGLFFLAWTMVKTFCFDAAGIVLAFSSGILFGGVLQGAVMSAIGATIGSSVAFALAKADTPVREKALEIVEDNPSLRGLEKVVADEGLKAVLTLRLAPILPIPLGMYNYVYGVTKVKYWDFAGGIFLGSLKPYFLDSYLGYFGKSIIDGSAAAQQFEGAGGSLQDYVLIGVLGLSVLIGVFASQLASETWDSILKEQEEEEKRIAAVSGGSGSNDNEPITEIFGVKLPQWIVGFQYGLQDAEGRMEALVLSEYDARVWNYTDANTIFGMEISKGNPIPDNKNPAIIDPKSPENTGRYTGFDFGATTCDGLVLSPILFSYFLKFADPLFDEDIFQSKWTDKNSHNPSSSVEKEFSDKTKAKNNDGDVIIKGTQSQSTADDTKAGDCAALNEETENLESEVLDVEDVLERLGKLKIEAQRRLVDISQKIDQIDNK